MSKLEDRLAAGNKPARKQPFIGKPPARKAAVPATPSPAPAVAAEPIRGKAESDLNAGVQPLHPRRIWPD